MTEAAQTTPSRQAGSHETASRLPVRTAIAAAAGRLAAAISKTVGVGAGGMIGGRVTLALAPQALAHLAARRTVVLVTATNGKTTTTKMITSALGGLGEVATNSSGANMPDGLVAALTARRHARYAALEIDETHLPQVLDRLTPAAVVLLNLSRDQMDRVGEVRKTERLLRDALSGSPSATVVANCDDVLVTSVAQDMPHTVWVAAGGTWHGDSAVCPRCGARVHLAERAWWCDCGLSRPEPSWRLTEDPSAAVHTPDGTAVPLSVALPGRANLSNATMAVAAAGSVGAAASDAAQRIAGITEVAGRYRVLPYSGRDVLTLLAKNPAGWQETLRVAGDRGNPLILGINAREADGRDPSWLWDVRFEGIANRPVIACGERAADLGVRLTYAGVPHSVVVDPLAAIEELPEGPVDMVANYTCFRDAVRRLDRAG